MNPSNNDYWVGILTLFPTFSYFFLFFSLEITKTKKKTLVRGGEGNGGREVGGGG